jgi:iron complex outermembrane recepter protein
VEAHKRDIIWQRDRDHSRFQDFNPPGEFDFFQTTGLSDFARNIFRPGVGRMPMISDDCSVYGDGHQAPIYTHVGGTQVCAYDFTRVAALTADLDRLNMFMDATYEINADHSFFTRLAHSRVESFGRYAPAAGAFVWPTAAGTLAEAPYNGQTLVELRPGDQVRYRFDNTGPARDSIQYNYQTDVLFGLEGTVGAADYQIGYQRNIYDMHDWGDGYVNTQGLALAAANGWDPRHPDQGQFENFVADMRENANRRAQMKYDRFDFGAQFDGPMMNAGPVLFFAGGEYREEKYFDQTQAQAEAGRILGTAGGSSGGTREAWAVFGEAAFPITPTFDIDVALRHDDYSDFGTNLSGKVTARWQPNQSFILRGSAGTGFRAPTLDQLFQAPSQSFVFSRDIAQCMGGTITEAQQIHGTGFGAALDACLTAPTLQHETRFDQNPNLDAETSTQFMIGTVFDFNEWLGQDLTLSLDYWRTEIDDQITNIGTQDVMWLYFMERIGEATGVEYNDPALGIPHRASPTNFESAKYSGVDLNLQYQTGIGNLGTLSFQTNVNYLLEYESRFTLLSQAQDYTDLTLNSYRADATLGWRLGPHSVNWHTYYIPGYCVGTTLDLASLDDATLTARCATDADGNKREIGGWAHHSVNYNFDTPFNSTITLGVNNVTDKDPQLDVTSDARARMNLYPLVGRQFLVRYTHRF